MSPAGKKLVAIATLPLAVAAMAFPVTTFAAEMPEAALAGPLHIGGASPADEILTAVDLALPAEDGSGSADAGKIDAELECMAKVVHHEAGNQPRMGQLAVAQTMMNRVESGRFADTICGVANQPGQFFRTAGYHPDRDSDAWKSAVAVSREARNGAAPEVAPGALFFRAAYASATNFFRGRERIASLGDHVFYR